MDRREFLKDAAAATAVRPQAPRLVDGHVHVWESDPKFPFAEGAVVPEVDASVRSLLRKMAANGVARTVLIQVIHYRWDNRFLVSALKTHPGLFAGVCRVNPEDPRAADQLSEWTMQGCHGVRLSPAEDARGDWIGGPLMPPLWKRCAELKVPMTLLTPVSRLPEIELLIEKHPEVTVVIDHMADCPVDDVKGLHMLMSLARYPRVFVKVSHAWSLSKMAYPYADAGAQIARLRDAFGAQRLMWGTDWPIKPELLSYDRRVALYRDELPFFTAQERLDLLSGTAERVWPGRA